VVRLPLSQCAAFVSSTMEMLMGPRLTHISTHSAIAIDGMHCPVRAMIQLKDSRFVASTYPPPTIHLLMPGCDMCGT
jgi:hypothetical protein